MDRLVSSKVKLNISLIQFNFFSFFHSCSGSGKTYTFLGPEKCLDDPTLISQNNGESSSLMSLPPSIGVVLRAGEELFQAKQAMSKIGITVSLVLQVVEVYEEKVSLSLSLYI